MRIYEPIKNLLNSAQVPMYRSQFVPMSCWKSLCDKYANHHLHYLFNLNIKISEATEDGPSYKNSHLD